MDWKDTVMDKEQIVGCFSNPKVAEQIPEKAAKEIAQAQAEISFKAGKLQGAIESVDKLIVAGRKAGIREVVEWIQSESTFTQKALDGQVWITKEQWQAKLKEWGIKNG